MSNTIVEQHKLVEQREQSRPQRKRQPRYSVILWDDDDHTYDYVIRMMQELFGHDQEQAWQIADCVNNSGRAVCLTTTLEHAELKRDQIHGFGADAHLSRCKGAMFSTIEPIE
jgi:ATP-dependent Clp protease adaptor protein ClpS